MVELTILAVMLSVLLFADYKVNKMHEEHKERMKEHRKFLEKMNRYMDNRRKY